MIKRTTRLKVRRKFKRGRKQVEGISEQAEEHFDRHFFKRLIRLFEVRRFVIGWILLLVILSGGVTLQLRALTNYYQQLEPAPGGTFTEGIIGSFTNASPIYATGLVDTSVSRLIFAGLLKYDDQNHLIGDLAESWKVDKDGKVYTVKLRPDLKWQDNQPVTANDVAFTFQTIQNPDAQSPLFHAWRGITVKAVDSRTVTFSLPNTLAPFVYSLTTGIVPQHVLKNIQPAQLRSSAFNTSHPIGAGPFKLQTVETINEDNDNNSQHIGLSAFSGYHSGTPKLQQFVLKTYSKIDQLVDAFEKQDINALAGLNSVPEVIKVMQQKDPNTIREYTSSLTAETAVFLRTDSDMLKDVRVRQALTQAVNTTEIIKGLPYPVILADEPFLHNQVGYNPTLKQLPTNIEQANKLLDEAGWKRADPKAVRTNGTAKLSLKFYAQNNADYSYITQQIQNAWKLIGVEAQVILPTDAELQSTVNNRAYDALLYGISVGSDPDVFAYWHSTQVERTTSRLNLSNYKSTVVDKSLEAGRSRLDANLRTAKYLPFLQTWRNDAPAIML